VSNNFVPDATDLLAGELARASDINVRYGYVVSGFDKLPAPLSVGQGFSAPVPVGEPTDNTHAVTKLYADTTVTAAAVAAAVPASEAASLAAVAPEVTNAANSATAAAGSAATASGHVTDALGHVNTALGHANAAATSATNSANSATAAAGSLTSFEAIYLGVSTSAPSTSGVAEGALYWNSSLDQLYVLDSGSWQQGAFNVSGAVIADNNLSDLSDVGAAVSNLGLSYNTISVTVAGGKFVVDGTSQQKTVLTPSVQYRFDQSHSSNANHPIKFSTTADGTHDSGTEFTTNVVSVGTPGQAGAYTTITVEQDSPILYYYCANHSGMGERAYAPGSSGGASSSTDGSVEGYYPITSPPEDLLFKNTHSATPNNLTVLGTYQGFSGPETILQVTDIPSIDSHGSYISEDTSVTGHLFYQTLSIMDGKTFTVSGLAQGTGTAPVQGAATDKTRSSGELIYFGLI
jgi:hypothetical protein